MDCLLNLSPPGSILIIAYVKMSELIVLCKPSAGTGLNSAKNGIGESPAFPLPVKNLCNDFHAHFAETRLKKSSKAKYFRD